MQLKGCQPLIQRTPVAADSSSARYWVLAPTILTLACILLQFSPTLLQITQYDRAAIETGQWWRLFTGNLAHWTWFHLLCDLGIFASLFWLIENRLHMMLLIVSSSLGVGVGVYFLAGEIQIYRGISGINYALLAWILITNLWHKNNRIALLYLTGLILVVAKTVAELLLGHALLPSCCPPDALYTAAAHYAGIFAALVLSLIFCRRYQINPQTTKT